MELYALLILYTPTSRFAEFLRRREEGREGKVEAGAVRVGDRYAVRPGDESAVGNRWHFAKMPVL